MHYGLCKNGECGLQTAVYRGGSRGRVQGVRTPPPRDDLRFSNTTGILHTHKKLCGLLVSEQSKRQLHPLLKKKPGPAPGLAVVCLVHWPLHGTEA